MTTNIRIAVTDSSLDGYSELGRILTDPSDISRYFRLAFNDESPEPWKHSDDVIFGIINEHPQQPGQDDEDYNGFVIEQMAEFEPQTLVGTALDVIQEQAKSFEQMVNAATAKLNRSEALGRILQALDEASKMDYMGPVHVHKVLEEEVNNDPDLWSLLPEPGTRKEDVAGTNEPYDKYSKVVVGSSGTRRVKVMSIIEESAKGMALSVAARALSDAYKAKIGEKQAIGSNQSKKAAEDKTISIVKRHFRLAVNLLHRFKQVQNIPGLSVQYFKETDGQARGLVRVTPKPISIYDVKNAVEKQGAFSVSQFALMNPRKAIKAMAADPTLNVFDALIGSAEGRESEPKPMYPTPKKLEDMQTLVNVFASAIRDAEMYSLVEKEAGKDTGSEMVSALILIHRRVDGLLAAKQITNKQQRVS